MKTTILVVFKHNRITKIIRRDNTLRRIPITITSHTNTMTQSFKPIGYQFNKIHIFIPRRIIRKRIKNDIPAISIRFHALHLSAERKASLLISQSHVIKHIKKPAPRQGRTRILRIKTLPHGRRTNKINKLNIEWVTYRDIIK